MIDQDQQRLMAKDTLILQKVNGAHREAFVARFPGQVEHLMRLTAERLQAVLAKKPQDLADISTWKESPEEIRAMSEALNNLSQISKIFPVEGR